MNSSKTEKKVKGNKDGKRKAREMREAHFAVTRKMYGEIKISLLSHLPICISPLSLHSKHLNNGSLTLVSIPCTCFQQLK